MNPIQPRHLVDMSAFSATEPFYDICESWAEEPSAEAWEAHAAAVYTWVIRAN